MESAFIGLVGIVIGILLTEYYRKRNRIEIYSQKIFDKRLEIHEELLSLIQTSYHVAEDIISNEEMNESKRKNEVSSIILAIAEYSDRHALYLNPYLSTQAVTTFMGVENIYHISDPIKKEAAISNIRANYKKTKEIIAQESGINEVLKHFESISKSSPDSDIIRYMKKYKKNKGTVNH